MAKKVITAKDLSLQQSKTILEKLNKVNATELHSIIEASLSDSPIKLVEAILQKKKALTAFTDPKQLMEIKGIGPKEFSLLAQSILHKPTVREKLLKPEDVTTTISNRVLEFLNTAPHAKFISKSIEVPGLRDIGIETAEKIINLRLEKGSIKTLAELDGIPGVGQKRFTDIVNALKNYPLPAQLLTPETVSAADAEIVLTTLNQAKSPVEIDKLINTPLLADVGSKLAESIYFTKLELGGFKTLVDIDNISGIGPAKFTSIVMSLTKPVESIPAAQSSVIKKTTLAQFLQFYLTPEDKNRMIIGTDSVSTAVEKLSAVLPQPQSQYLKVIFADALESDVIDHETSVADLVYFPHIATNITLSPPPGIIDPASLPEISPDIKWFKTRGVSFYQFDGPATVEILTPSGWGKEITLNAPVAFQPAKEGMVVRNVIIESGQFFEPTTLLFGPAPAYRITCRGGVRGRLTFKPRNLDPQDPHVAHVPPDWFFPGNEVWINPVNNDFLPKPEDPPRPHGTLPGRVIIGGGSTAPGATDAGGNEEDDDDHVFIGSQVFIVKEKPLPWPWGPGPWPPWPFGPDPSPDRSGLYDAPPRIYGEEIDTDISLLVTGCECVRRNEIEEYIAHPAPEGGTYKWVVEDDDIAEIQGPDDQKSVELKGLDIGKTTLTLKYSKDSYEASFEMGISVIYQQFTMKDQPRAEIVTVPLIQPSPAVRISSIDTRPKVDSVNLERHKAKFKFRVDGLLKDALIEITSVKVCAASGFEVDLPKEETEKGKFDDDMFFANDVEITGPGRSYIRVIAKNTISFVGTDTAQVVTRLKATDEEKIRQIESEWAIAKDDGDPSVIEDKRKALETAWDDALKNVEVEVGYLTHTDNTVQKAPGENKWSVSVEDDVKMGMVKLQNTIDGHDLVLEEEEEKLIAPEEDPTSYFLLHRNYGERDELTWEEDGKMLGEAGTPMQLVYLADCCGHDAPIIGVEFEKKPGIQFIKKSESIKLEAKGKPESFETIRGIYHWKVAAHPAGAVFRFEPADPTVDKVNFFTDTPGVYTFRVDYELAGMTSPWTYALCDAQIVFKVKTVPRLFRLGQYDGEMAKHLDRPYYAERSDKPQRGAEIMIYNSESGPIGQEMKITVLCPMELTLSDTMKARAFFADDTVKDYPMYVDGKFNFMAEAEIISAQVIQRLYIIDIQYGDLQRYKGDAVWIDVRVRPLDPVILDLDEGLASPTVTTPVPSANGTTADATAPEVIDLEAFVKIAINEDDTIEVTNDGSKDIQPRVNLLLYNRDLGAALPSRGFEILSNSGECHNLPNGNFYIPIPILESKCHGISTSVSLTYNSLQALFQDSLELFRLMNGIKQADIEKYYCPNPLGRGWTHNYNIYVRDYIKPGATYTTLIFYIEVVTPDGNRIQMKISDNASPDTDGLGDYYPEFKSDHLLGAAEYGHSLVLTKSKSQDKIEYLLKDIHGQEWKFDDQGRLVEIHNRLTRNSSTKPVLLEYGNTSVKIKDSIERETVVNFLQPGGDTTLFLETPDGEMSLISYTQGLLTNMMLRGGSQTWSFEYETDFLQISSIQTSLVKKITEPEGVVIEAQYYDGKEFRGVKEEIAKDFWGKLGRTQKDAGEDGREHLWRYEAYDEENQKLIYTNPEKVEFAITFQRSVMAVTTRSYIKQEVDDTTKKLKGSPNYQQVLDGEIQQLEEVAIENYTYFNKTKLIEKHTDLQANETKYEYWQIPGRDAYVLKKVTGADGIADEFEIDADTNLPKKVFNPYKTSQGFFTKYTYNNIGAVREKTLPPLDSTAPGDALKETFEYDADTGQLKNHTQVDGLKIDYTYYDPGRDDDRTGLCTGKYIKITKGQPAEKTLKWETSYDKMGNILLSYEPLHGGSVMMKYKKMHLLEEASLQKILTDRGIEESQVEQFAYNNLYQRRSRINNISGESWEYNNHGEVILHSNAISEKCIVKFDKTGQESQVTDATGATLEYIRDELGRITRVNYPIPDSREPAKRSESYTDIFVHNDKDKTFTRRRFITSSLGGAPGELRSEQIIQYEKGKTKMVTQGIKPGNQVVKTEFIYGDFSDVTEILVYDNDDLKQKSSIVQDSWGRTIEQTESDGSVSRTTKTNFNTSGTVSRILPPSPAGLLASKAIEYDELGRPLRVKDSFSVVTQEYQYFDFGNTDDTSQRNAYVVCKAQDPSANEGEDRLLLKSRTELNKRGLAFATYFKKDQSLTDAQFTAPDLSPVLNRLYRSETQFDCLGRNMKEIKFTGVTQEYLYDALHRVREVKSSQLTRRSNIPFDQLDANNPAHFTTASEFIQYIYHPNGHAKEIHESSGSNITEFDAIGRAIRVFDQPFGNPRQLKEEITYDANDRPLKRFFRNNKKQEFEYRDNTRTVVITSENAASKVITESTHDWDGKVLSFKHLENLHRNPIVYGAFKRISLQYQYGNFGKLKAKSYFDGNDLLGSIEYDYNGADLRSKTKLNVKRSNGTTFLHETFYNYDANLRMTELSSGGSTSRYVFQYNSAGLMKMMGRPSIATSTSSPFGNATVYEHDHNGLLTKMIEEKGVNGNAVMLSQLDFYYQRQQPGTWETQTPASFDIMRVDTLQSNPFTLKRLSYRRFFNEQGSTDRDIYTQDYAYDSNGQIFAAITRHLESSSNEVFVDSRYTDGMNAGSQQFTRKHFRRFEYPNIYETTRKNFTDTIVTVYGYPNLVVSRMGARPVGAPKLFPKNYLTQNIYDADRLLKEEYSLEENFDPSLDARPHTEGRQIHKFYYHNAIDQLMITIDRTENRLVSTTFAPHETDAEDQSMNNTTWHQYGVDGTPVFRSLSYWEQPLPGVAHAKSSETFILSDGAYPVVEYNKTEGALRHYHIVPGLNVRLEARTSFDNSTGVTGFYRTDHRGSTIFLTDLYGEVKTDFNYKSNDGQSDLFGLTNAPRAIGTSVVTPQMLTELLSFYVGAGPRLDISMREVPALESSQERLQVHGQAAEGVQNPYGYNSGKPYVFIDTDLILKTEYGPEGVRMRDTFLSLDRLQLGLDVLGLVPVVGEVFDAANGVIHLFRGNKADAALSFSAMVPFIGGLATAAKLKGAFAITGALTAYKATTGTVAVTAVAVKSVSAIGGVAGVIRAGGSLLSAATILFLRRRELLKMLMSKSEDVLTALEKRAFVDKHSSELTLLLESVDDQVRLIADVQKNIQKHHIFTIYGNFGNAKGAVIAKIQEFFHTAGWKNLDDKAIDAWNLFKLDLHKPFSRSAKYRSKFNKAGAEVGRELISDPGHSLHYHQWLLDILVHKGAQDITSKRGMQKLIKQTAKDVKQALINDPRLLVADSIDFIKKHGGDLGKIY